MDSKSQEPPRDISHRTFWLWFWGFVGVAVVFAWLINPDAESSVILGYAIGFTIFSLGLAIIVAGIRRIFTRNGFRLTVLQLWGVVLVLASIGNYVDRPTRVNNDVAVHEAAQNLADAVSQSPTTQPTDAATAKDTGTEANETDEQGMARVMNQLADAMRQHRAAFQELMKNEQALPLSNLLTPESLTSAQGVADGRRMVEEYGHYLDGFQSEAQSYNDRVRAIIAAAPSGVRVQMEQGFNETNGRTQQAIANYIMVERTIMTTVSQIMDLAQRNLGSAYAKDGQIYLPPGQLTQYQSLIQQMRDETVQEDEATNTLDAISREGVEKIKQAAEITDSNSSH